MFNKVFISYAREDFEYAKDIYNFLDSNNFSPWMDKKKLLVGQKWEYHILNELKTADYIIILLSKTSVVKRGFVQREFKYALKYAEEKLNSDIFILPVKLDDCIVPEELAIFNWADNKELETNNEIVKALNEQRNKMITSLPADLMELKNYSEQKVILDGDVKSIFEYDINYPIFYSTKSVNTEMLNDAIRNYINEHISFIHQEMDDGIDEEDLKRLKEFKYTYEVSYTVGYLNNDFVSIMFYEYTEFRGPHPNYYCTSINVSFNRNKIMSYSNFLNLESLKEFLLTYRFDFDEEASSEENNIDEFNEYSDSEYFHPKKFEYLLLDEKNILIDFSNHLPHVAKALGQFEFKYRLENGRIKITK